MYKQVYDKSNGRPKLIDTGVFDKDIYTDIKPTDGLYEPIYFNGKEWVGGTYEDWRKDNPYIPDEIDSNDEIIASLALELANSKIEQESLNNAVATLALQILELEDKSNA